MLEEKEKMCQSQNDMVKTLTEQLDKAPTLAAIQEKEDEHQKKLQEKEDNDFEAGS